MRNASICLLASALVFTGCEDKKEVTITETRPLTTSDSAPKLFSTSDERFRDVKPSPVKATLPDGWREVPASQFRMLNYRFGESGMGEAWVTIASGTVLDNVNRWLGQFGAPALDQAGLEKLRHLMVAGGEGVWVEAEGNYESGMGTPEKAGFALAGVVALIDGRIVTVKMVGPKAEVETSKPALQALTGSLRLAE
jgi:hypothetical protein